MKLSTFMRRATAPLSVAVVPEPKPLFRAVKRVLDRWPHVNPKIEEKDREKIALAFLDRINRNDWSECTVDDAARAGRAAFDAKLRDREDLGGLRDYFVRELRVSTKPGLLAPMVETHIESYSSGAPHTKALAKSIKEAKPRLTSSSLRLLEILPEALDPANGARDLGRRMAKTDKPKKIFGELYRQLSGGLIDEAGAQFVKELTPQMKNPVVGRICLDWFAPEQEDSVARISGANYALDAIFSPWLEDEPPAKWKETLLRRLPQAYGDPRLTRGGAWGPEDKPARQTFSRWLTGATLEAFLDIVSQAEDSHMWADRRPFWENLYQEGHIQDAWVAFSKQAARIAEISANSSGEMALKSYGRQVARGNTSLLILKINWKIVVEGSHNYKVHVFPKGHPASPTLYLQHPKTYDCEKIRLSLPDNENFKKSHQGESWKKWVEDKTL